jgi:hypothetical protein
MLGRGALYFDRRTATDNKVGSFHLGNCDQFGINVATEKLDPQGLHPAVDLPYKEVVSSTDVGSPSRASSSRRTRWRWRRWARSRRTRRPTGAVTAEVLASATVTGLKGRTFFTAYKNISAVVLKQGATTFVLNTDYTIVDAVRGMIKILTTGAVADGTALTVDYTKAAITGGRPSTDLRRRELGDRRHAPLRVEQHDGPELGLHRLERVAPPERRHLVHLGGVQQVHAGRDRAVGCGRRLRRLGFVAVLHADADLVVGWRMHTC